MAGHEEQYVVDKNGNRVSVVLDVEEYQKLIQDLEELDSIRAYDRAKASGDQVIPFEQAVTEIETNRK
jgi:PHD/YefM family antitoxin component YafN of YafNO toxin-antitoxin module